MGSVESTHDLRPLPRWRAGQRIGLLGGSFDPAHGGHVALSRTALARMGLDAVWWLVTPGNPLKPRPPADLEERLAQARAQAMHPRIRVCAPEARWGTRRTVETLARLRKAAPGVRFVWLMGSDNLASFHRWHRWRDIAGLVPIAVIARPGARASAQLAPAAKALRPFRLRDGDAGALPLRPAPAWAFLTGPLNPLSSSGLRTLQSGGAGAAEEAVAREV